jgi:NADPH2:quinone reductase
MKAIRIHEFGEPSVLKLEDVPDPTPGAGQLVVRVQAVGVNPVETYIRKGIYGPREFPFTPGSDAAGVVEAVGDGVARWRAGDRVYVYGSLTGAYAQKALCKETQVYRLAQNVTFSQGAALGVPYATAHRAIFGRGHARPGETVLIHGASGGVGTAAVQLARALGMTVIGTGGTAEGRKLVAEQGAHHVLDHTNPDYLKQVMDLTGGTGVNLIIEMLANVNLGKDLTVLAKSGRVVVVGNRGNVEINAREAMARDADIRGMTLMNVTEAELPGIHAALAAGLENGTLRPIIRTELPLAQAAKAHEMVMATGAYGKIVLVP